MSNQLVGSVYHRIVEDVIQNLHTTFEEDGVDQQTLDDMKATWQKRLSNARCASYPWDPPPAPQPMANPTPLPSNVPRAQQYQQSSGPIASSAQAPTNGTGGMRIKAEPGTGFDLQSNGLPAVYGNPAAPQRAAQNLQEKYGAQASLQINQLQAQAALAAQGPQSQQSQQRPPHAPNPQLSEQQRQQRQQLDHQRRMYEQQRQQLSAQQAQQRGPVSNLQTDGAGDWYAMVAQRRAMAANGSEGLSNTQEVDMTLRERLEHVSQAMEGGGLMMPLSERDEHPRAKKQKFTESSTTQASYLGLVAAQMVETTKRPKIAQFDGPHDSEDDDKVGIKADPDLEDEDAINSDLDDSDDNVVDETEDDAAVGQMMLCTYDKVQRVKNKWKCVLKDGILSTGGKEYVFHKAQGEFEW